MEPVRSFTFIPSFESAHFLKYQFSSLSSSQALGKLILRNVKKKKSIKVYLYLITNSNALKLFNYIIFRNAVSSVGYIAKAHLVYSKFIVNV